MIRQSFTAGAASAAAGLTGPPARRQTGPEEALVQREGGLSMRHRHHHHLRLRLLLPFSRREGR